MSSFVKNQKVVYRGCEFIYIKDVADGNVLLRNKKVLSKNLMKAPAKHVYAFKDNYRRDK